MYSFLNSMSVLLLLYALKHPVKFKYEISFSNFILKHVVKIKIKCFPSDFIINFS